MMTARALTVVIGVDYSDYSIHAVDEALRFLATTRDVRLVPVLVLPGGPVTGTPDADEATRVLFERSKENLVQLLQTRARVVGVTIGTVEPRVHFGLPADRLLADARELDARLIAVGTHGRQGISHLLLGSVAEDVMRQAPCSVLVARAGAEPGQVGVGAAEERGGGRADVEEGGDPTPVSRASEPRQVSAPHIDAGRVVLHLLDPPSGQVFVCAFESDGSVRVEPLEGDWVPAPPSVARARVARFALEAAAREAALFGELYAEVARRRARQRES